jgi:hypothetical protein
MKKAILTFIVATAASASVFAMGQPNNTLLTEKIAEMTEQSYSCAETASDKYENNGFNAVLICKKGNETKLFIVRHENTNPSSRCGQMTVTSVQEI